MSARNVLTTLTRPAARLRSSVNPGVRILMYHRVNDFGGFEESGGFDQLRVRPSTFEDQMRWLSEHRLTKSTADVVAEIQSGKISKNVVAVTFDDGYLDNLEYALPILEKYSIPATIYITSDFAAQTDKHYRYQEESGRLHLNWNEIRDLANHELITIGSHTVTHPMLSELSEKKALAEIQGSKSTIEANIDHQVDEFCYPSGNYTWREEQMAKDCGYRLAVTVRPGLNRAGKSLHALKRTEVTDKDDVQAFATKMDGAFDIFHRLLDLKREIIFARNRR